MDRPKRQGGSTGSVADDTKLFSDCILALKIRPLIALSLPTCRLNINGFGIITYSVPKISLSCSRKNPIFKGFHSLERVTIA
jgi:hypothetical protein